VTPGTDARVAGPGVREDLLDHRRLCDEGDKAHRAVAGRARERVDRNELLQEDRPSAGSFGRRESCGGDDQGWRIGGGGLCLTSHPARTVGIPAVGPTDLSDRYVTAFAAGSQVSRSRTYQRSIAGRRSYFLPGEIRQC
jgi:hypothetical protein